MSDFIAGLTKELEAAAKGIARIRHCTSLDAWRDVHATMSFALHDSANTSMESYFAAAEKIASRYVQHESGFTSVGAGA